VPLGIVQLKEEEFQELTQGGRSISEYVDKFIELACYAPNDVSMEAKKMACFLKGLRQELKTILASQDFLSFSHLSNKDIVGTCAPRKMIQRGSESYANRVLAQEGDCSVI
jgi:hypothetical protein